MQNEQIGLLSERAQTLLKVLVERYIGDGRPVGSRTLSRVPGLDLSPATIRNVMADLEEQGFIKAPHTSAGRVPTASGYRFFVDSLIQLQPPSEEDVATLSSSLDPDAEVQELLTSASNLLSSTTQLVGLVSVPRHERVELRHIEFVPLSERRVLVIIVTNDREVQNSIIRTERDFSADELRQFANYLNSEFVGRTLDQLRNHLVHELEGIRIKMDQVMGLAIHMASQVFADRANEADDYVLSGQTNLMGFEELSDLDTLRQLFEAFNEKRDILHVLDQSICTDGIKIFIGKEAGVEPLGECSVITAPYARGGDGMLGVLGVIGPTRLPYDRVIPVVEVTARLLGAALKPSH